MRSLKWSRAIALASITVVTISCGPDALRIGTGDSPSAASGGNSGEAVPSADEPIPRRPGKLARVINDNEARLVRGLKVWRRNGAYLSGSLVDELKLRALYQQRITRRLSRWSGLSRRVLSKLDGRARWFYRANIRASRALASLSAGTLPKKPPRFKYAPPESPRRLMRFYGIGKRRFRVPKMILASVNFVETKFGRVLGPSSAGARGPMQFLPSTWEAYGAGGDIWDPRDSIVGAARYLNASGAPERMRDALYSYNPSETYVKTILIYARQMRLHPLRYHNYYLWQVFVRTRDETIQMTGPGSPRPHY